MHKPDPVDPTNPESSPDATVRLSMVAPADPYSTQKLDLTKHLADASTLDLPLVVTTVASDQTQKLVLPRMDEPPIRVQRVDQPAEVDGQTQKRPLRPGAARSNGWKLPLSLGLLVVIGVAAYLVFARGSTPQPLLPAAVVTPESVPPAVQVYLEQAKAGDVHAMRTLGAYYYNGLNVPRDREKGLSWYRKAAENGSDAARSELSQIEGGR
jgi:hypothetical protein